MEPKLINKLAKEIHAQNQQVGWWNEPDPCLLTKAQLIVTEVAEATEGLRKELMDDKLPHRLMEEVELADALIRTLDLGTYAGCSYFETDTHEKLAAEFSLNQSSPAGLHFLVSTGAVLFGCSFLKSTEEFDEPSLAYSALIDTIIIVSKMRGFDLFEAAQEKLKYNLTRADHKPENRALAGGEKF